MFDLSVSTEMEISQFNTKDSNKEDRTIPQDVMSIPQAVINFNKQFFESDSSLSS